MKVLRVSGLALLGILCLYGLFFAVQTLRPRQLALSLPDNARAGDVVLMRSHTWRAELVRLIDGVPYADGFSHVGLVHDRNADGSWRIVHAVPGADGTVRLEDWASVARGGGSSEAVLFRAPDMNAAERAQLIDLQADAARRAVPFDARFDHHDPSALYCTELVTALYAQAGLRAVPDRILEKRAIFPGHLAGSPHLQRVVPD